jgi:hypothetical protein
VDIFGIGADRYDLRSSLLELRMELSQLLELGGTDEGDRLSIYGSS